MEESKDLKLYKNGFYYATALGILAVFVFSYLYYQDMNMYQEKLRGCADTIKEQNEYAPAGKAIIMVLQDFATQLNTSKENLILDCRDTAFLDDRYGICVIREKNNSNDFLVTMRLNFTTVE